MSYTTRSKVEQYANIDLSAVSSEVTNWIASVKSWIDKYCGKTFESAPETRYFDGNDNDRLLIDSFHGTPTDVSVLNTNGTVHKVLTEGASNDYVAYPLNETEKNEIVLMPNSPVRRFSRAFFDDILDDSELHDDGFTKRRILSVTANFGASASVPADVELAATMLVAKIAQGRVSGGNGAVKSESLGDYSVSFVDGNLELSGNALSVLDLLSPWVDIEI